MVAECEMMWSLNRMWKDIVVVEFIAANFKDES